GCAGPGVDSAILRERREVGKKMPWRRAGAGAGAAERAPGNLSDRLTEVLESDDHAVGVLWALLAGRGDQPRADALPEPLAGPPGGGSAPGGLSANGGRKASGGGGRPPGLPRKTATGPRRGRARLWRRGDA